MLEFMRRKAKFFYFVLVLIIASFMFWVPGMNRDNQSSAQNIATVGKTQVSSSLYYREYDRLVTLYRSVYAEEFDDAMREELKQTALQNLVQREILSQVAADAGIRVTDAELQDAIVQNPSFIREGSFSALVYENTLRQNRLSPQLFEESLRQDLLVRKFYLMLEATVTLTPSEEEMFQGDEELMTRIRESLLENRRQGATASYINGMKQNIPVTVNETLL